VNEMWNFRSKFQHGYVIIFINRNDSIKSRLSCILHKSVVHASECT